MQLIQRFLADTSGATAIEYGLIIALVSLAIVGGVGRVADGVASMFADQDREIQKAFNK
jgi:pilus assembly protein Flp/PilA